MYASLSLPTFLSGRLGARFVLQQHSISAHDARNSSTAAVQIIQEIEQQLVEPWRSVYAAFEKKRTAFVFFW